MSSIREQYLKHGVDTYYQLLGDNYKNPHAVSVIECLSSYYSPLKHRKILDLACGDGLVTKWIGKRSNIIGCDKFLYKRYEDETGRKCLPYSFADISDFNNPIDNNFDLIVFSYAIDLVEYSYIQQLLYRLSFISNEMIVIRPNNKVIDSPFWTLYQKKHVDKSKSSLYISNIKS